MTVREVARACGRTEETVRRWIWSGKLPARKLGHQLFVARSDVDALIAPRVSEAKTRYSTRRSHVASPERYLEKKRYTRQEMISAIERAAAMGREMRKKYGGFDVGELAYQSHETGNA